MVTSGEVSRILPALSAARQAFDPLVRKGVNAFLKDGSGKNARYVRLEDVFAAIDAALEANDLLVTQAVGESLPTGEIAESVDKQGVVSRYPIFSLALTTRVWHVTGEWIEFDSVLLYHGERGISLAQAGGKTITYLRRYAITSFFCLSTEDDDDAQPGAGRGTTRSAPDGAGRGTPDGMDGRAFVAQWAELFGGDADAAKRALNGVLPAGKVWKDVKEDRAWLKRTYEAMRDSLAQQAADEDADLRDELSEIANE